MAYLFVVGYETRRVSAMVSYLFHTCFRKPVSYPGFIPLRAATVSYPGFSNGLIHYFLPWYGGFIPVSYPCVRILAHFGSVSARRFQTRFQAWFHTRFHTCFSLLVSYPVSYRFHTRLGKSRFHTP